MDFNLQNKVYGIVGLGIMGGTIAKTIRKKVLSDQNSSGKIYACDKNENSLKNAQNQNVIDKSFSLENVNLMLSECDILFVCLYPHATIEFLKTYQNDFKKDSIVTDISGVKQIFEEQDFHLNENFDFIIGHPMAGGEKEGYESSKDTFFENRNYILIPTKYNKKENYEFFKNLIFKMGFSKITETTSEIHDYKIGFTSQLCHVIASALVESAPDEKITDFGGGSFEDLTRIAMINAPLWTELFTSNKEKLLFHIDNFIEQMQIFRDLISQNKKTELKDLLEDVRQKRILMSKK